MAKTIKLDFTYSELEQIHIILSDYERVGDYWGRKDYFDKRTYSINTKIKNAFKEYRKKLT